MCLLIAIVAQTNKQLYNQQANVINMTSDNIPWLFLFTNYMMQQRYVIVNFHDVRLLLGWLSWLNVKFMHVSETVHWCLLTIIGFTLVSFLAASSDLLRTFNDFFNVTAAGQMCLGSYGARPINWLRSLLSLSYESRDRLGRKSSNCLHYYWYVLVLLLWC